MTTFNPETIEEKRAYLESLGYFCSERDARLNTNYPGAYMVVENDYADYELLPTEDGSDGPWCIVGDDLNALIEDAFGIWFDESEAENLERAYRIATA